MSHRTFNPKATKKYRRRLRRNMTSEESLLWMHLSNRKIDGLKFRKQNGVLFYIADFFCFERMLAIELDGSQHYTPEGRAKDKIRDEEFASLGITVLRFPNWRVRKDVNGVVEEIRQVAKSLPEHDVGFRKRNHDGYVRGK